MASTNPCPGRLWPSGKLLNSCLFLDRDIQEHTVSSPVLQDAIVGQTLVRTAPPHRPQLTYLPRHCHTTVGAEGLVTNITMAMFIPEHLDDNIELGRLSLKNRIRKIWIDLVSLDWPWGGGVEEA